MLMSLEALVTVHCTFELNNNIFLLGKEVHIHFF